MVVMQVTKQLARIKTQAVWFQSICSQLFSIMPLKEKKNSQNYILRIQLKWKENRNKLEMCIRKFLKEKGHHKN